MSLIHEALKKSEQQRQLGKAPDLSTLSQWTPRARVAPRRNGLWITLATLGLGALAAGTWYAWNSGMLGEYSERAMIESIAGSAPNVESPSAASQSNSQSSAETATPRQLDAAATMVVEEPVIAVNVPAEKQAMMDQIAYGEDVAKAAQSETNPDTLQKFAKVEPMKLAQPETSKQQVEDEELAKAAQAIPPVSQAPSLPVTTPIDVGGVAVISVFDLPYATRQALPKMKITMHVFAQDPNARFIIVDGKRYGEGQPAGEELDLSQITPDGVVFSHRGQKFYVPRLGF